MIQNLLNKNYEDLTEQEKMILAVKGALEQYKAIKEENEQKAMLGAFIATTTKMLKEQGIDIF